jgi:aryl-alcohol dehydrogenase-like predicted oxidoreductase
VRYTSLGRSGAVVSRFALGTMTFGAATTAEDAHAQLDLFAAAGGTFVETADIYGNGEAERILGAWLARLDDSARSRIFLASNARYPVYLEPRDA